MNDAEHNAGYEQGKQFAEGILNDINAKTQTIKNRYSNEYLEGFTNALADCLMQVPCGANETE